MSKVEEEIARRFNCVKCKSSGAKVKSLAMTGTGLSRLMNFQHSRYTFVSCLNCGYTEVYNLDILSGGEDKVINMLDIIFG